MRSFALSLCAVALWASSTLARLYTIFNDCPQNINLYINGVSQGSLGVGATTTRELEENWSGFIYTDANGGNGSTGERTTRAGFYGEVSSDTKRFAIVSPSKPSRMTTTTSSLTLLV